MFFSQPTPRTALSHLSEDTQQATILFRLPQKKELIYTFGLSSLNLF